ncbi:hypothetical protein ACFZAU_25280 [Streptomyces sp. NPDC008238]
MNEDFPQVPLVSRGGAMKPSGNEHEKKSPLGEDVTEDETVPPQEEYTSSGAEQRGTRERGQEDLKKEQGDSG